MACRQRVLQMKRRTLSSDDAEASRRGQQARPAGDASADASADGTPAPMTAIRLDAHLAGVGKESLPELHALLMLLREGCVLRVSVFGNEKPMLEHWKDVDALLASVRFRGAPLLAKEEGR